jgi:hypothetical protein
MEHAELLFEIVRAVTWDEGEAVLAVVEGILRDHAPFEAGEVAILGPIGFERYAYTAESMAAEDLLLEARRRGGTLKVDDIRDTAEFPRTRDLMERQGLRSLLVLPLASSGGVEGWIVLGRDHIYGFAGVRLRLLEPVAAMAGLALLKARSLSKLHKRLPILVEVAPSPVGDHSPEEAPPATDEGSKDEPVVRESGAEASLEDSDEVPPKSPEESEIEGPAGGPGATEEPGVQEAALLAPAHVEDPDARPEGIEASPALSGGEAAVFPAPPHHETRAERRARRRANRRAREGVADGPTEPEDAPKRTEP